MHLAKHLGVTREHLSRTFAAEGAPNLKRVIDLVRLLAAAELAKNPGYDIRDVASVLDFASSSHLSSTAQRVVGMSAFCAVGYLRRPWRLFRTVRNVMAERSETALEQRLIEYKQRRWLRDEAAGRPAAGPL